jgi:hypothetical protein
MLEKALGVKLECCPCPKAIITIENGEPIPPEYTRPCPVGCPCHHNRITIVEIVTSDSYEGELTDGPRDSAPS